MNLGNRGQSALEYLMTYGWALVVIVIAVAALVVLINPGTIQGNQCDTKFGQFTVSQSNVTAAQTQLVLVNQTGQSVTFFSADINGTNPGNTQYAGAGNVNFADVTASPNQTVTLTVDQTDLSSGSYNLTYTINYGAGQLTSGLTATGNCRGTV